MGDRQAGDAWEAIRTVVAYHGAGRAVAAAALGHDVYDIAVCDARTEVSHRPCGEGPRDAESELVILLAGPRAERRAAALMREPLDWWACGDDADVWLATVRDLESGAVVYAPCARGFWPDNDALALAWIMEQVPDCEREDRLDDARCSAAEILAREWREVEAVARCLGGGPLGGCG
jgi:hypothetical protein